MKFTVDIVEDGFVWGDKLVGWTLVSLSMMDVVFRVFLDAVRNGCDAWLETWLRFDILSSLEAASCSRHDQTTTYPPSPTQKINMQINNSMLSGMLFLMDVS